MNHRDVPPAGTKMTSQQHGMPLRLIIYEISAFITGMVALFLPGMSNFAPFLFGAAGLLHLARGGWWLFFPSARRIPASRLATIETSCLLLTGLALFEAQVALSQGWLLLWALVPDGVAILGIGTEVILRLLRRWEVTP